MPLVHLSWTKCQICTTLYMKKELVPSCFSVIEELKCKTKEQNIETDFLYSCVMASALRFTELTFL